jgi:hypothetical protein
MPMTPHDMLIALIIIPLNGVKKAVYRYKKPIYRHLNYQLKQEQYL